ncbi:MULTISPECIES: LysR family transcriptional regulator [Brucella/Ochrobactrum group]|jgi:LysR family nitrogen assimilation transcriptional regulator|uniref:LysR family transcriptional regulator n=1 Tax=Brucella/Ochrobactrum group TaxID=2826938 RepID=UPI001C057044|nr:LysR family transcriptional regulator [Brucella sp. NBRC 12950]QWK81011.1 LysR family transcriptional regulator [Ochrobactrum sp. BTU1]GLU27446.1 LysR family transcriptional regulator [Brucella sp. NBRC 12950]
MILTVIRMRYFVSIAEHGSLTKASAELGIAQPALSHHIRLLEDELNVKLLTRTARGMVLTEAGDTLLVHCQSILHALERAENATREKASVPSGDVILGVVSSIAPILAPPLIKVCREKYPRLRLILREGDSQTLKSGLEAGSYDIVVNLSDVAGKDAPLAFREGLYVLGAAGYFKGKSPQIELQNLADLPLILPSRKHAIRILMEREAEKAGFSLNVSLEIEGAGSIKAAVRAGLGMTVMGWSLTEPESTPHNYSSALISKPALYRKFAMFTAQRSRTSNAVLAVQNQLKQLVSDFCQNGHWKLD